MVQKKIKKEVSKLPKKHKKISSLPKVEKELKDFIADDEGKMTRKDVAKLGVSLAVLGMMMQPGSTQATKSIDTYTSSHTNTITPQVVDGKECAVHNNVTVTTDNHYNHSDGSWMC